MIYLDLSQWKLQVSTVCTIFSMLCLCHLYVCVKINTAQPEGQCVSSPKCRTCPVYIRVPSTSTVDRRKSRCVSKQVRPCGSVHRAKERETERSRGPVEVTCQRENKNRCETFRGSRYPVSSSSGCLFFGGSFSTTHTISPACLPRICPEDGCCAR